MGFRFIGQPLLLETMRSSVNPSTIAKGGPMEKSKISENFTSVQSQNQETVNLNSGFTNELPDR